MGLISKLFGTRSQREVKALNATVDKIEALEEEYRALSDHDLRAKTAEFKSRLAGGETLDASGCYVIPGLVDVHFHGCVGHDFCDGTNEAISALARYEAKSGVTAICPATMTYSEEI